MKTLLSALFVLALVFVQPEAQAKRLGGGKSLGQQSSNVTQRDATPPAAPGAPTQNAAAPAKPATPAAAPQVAPKKPWGAML
ncbi:MAG TPA: Tim44 domain-containing protein, partial [Giesbergeria sp.]|nr:Tim44 domain-containing protein [Giesbergeria sp.]